VSEVPPTRPAATVVILRDGDDGLEVLLLRKNKGLGFAAGMWVFPGGRVDPEDVEAGGDELGAARHAAIREAAEEAALVVDPDHLVALSHWTPPTVEVKRYATWFFLAAATGEQVSVDGGEIVDHEWLSPKEALARHAAGEATMLPPTWVTLHFVAQHATVADALAAAAAREPDVHVTKIVSSAEGETVAMWEGDAAYEGDDLDVEGGRHRLSISSLPWRYERG
jgi:8-oxo-dGTP pyrophosphatase MutT (NUDIX family)